MNLPLRIRTIKETLLANIELLPERDLWRPIIQRADDNGLLPSPKEGVEVLRSLGLDPMRYVNWVASGCSSWRGLPYQGQPTFASIAELHEFWVSQQPDLSPPLPGQRSGTSEPSTPGRTDPPSGSPHPTNEPR